MERARTAAASIVASLALALVALPALPDFGAAQQSGEIQVLVAPLLVQEGVNGRFGQRVADEVRKALETFSGMSALDKREVNKVIKQFGLDPDKLSPIEWRQLGGRMGAQLVMIGTASKSGGGVAVDADFVDPRTGDLLPIQEFTVPSDKDHKQAAAEIMQSLETGVKYQQAVVYCGEYLGSKALDDAMRNCESALAINPTSMRAMYLRSRIHMEAGNWSAAAEDLERVVEASPSNTDALQSLAFTHAQLGNDERSFELYKDYLAFNPGDADVRLKIAFDLASTEAYDAAIAILEEGVQRDEENATFWEYLGHFALAKGTMAAGDDETSEEGSSSPVSDPEAVRLAVRAFDRVLTLKGDDIDPAILKNVIAANLELGDLDAALEFSERALGAISEASEGEGQEAEGEESSEPTQTKEQLLASIHSQRADIFGRQENYTRALEEMDTTLQLDPSYPNGHFKRANLRLQAGDRAGAVSDFRAAAEAGSDADQIGQNIFARAYQDYFQKGRYGEAIELFNVALELAKSPANLQQIHFFAGFGYYQMGTAIDNSNEQAEACGPARRALNVFQRVLPHIRQAGSYQPESQAQIRDAVDVQLYRQEQIVKKACK